PGAHYLRFLRSRNFVARPEIAARLRLSPQILAHGRSFPADVPLGICRHALARIAVRRFGERLLWSRQRFRFLLPQLRRNLAFGGWDTFASLRRRPFLPPCALPRESLFQDCNGLSQGCFSWRCWRRSRLRCLQWRRLRDWHGSREHWSMCCWASFAPK